MLKSIEVSGKTEDDAIEKALEQLGMSRDDVSVEIMERAKTGFLGLKNTPAVIKVIYEDESEEDTELISDTDLPQKLGAGKKEKAAPKKQTAQEDLSAVGKKDAAEAFLVGLFEKMDVPVEIKINEYEESINISLTTNSAGTLIGRRGETLDAIQHLTNYVVNRGNANRVRVNVDAEDYRQRRNETLEGVAMRTASKVIKNRRNMTLEPMNAYERHVIHTALQDYENVNTFSIGSEPNRRVVIAYGKAAGGDSGFRGKRPQKSSFSGGSSANSEDRKKSTQPPEDPPAYARPAEEKPYREWS